MARAINSLPGSGISQDQHRGVAGRNRSGLRQYSLQRRAFSHNLFEVEFGANLLFQVEFFAGQLIRELRRSRGRIGRCPAPPPPAPRPARENPRLAAQRRSRSLLARFNVPEFAFARGQRNTARGLDAVFQHLADEAGLNSHQIFTGENFGFPFHQGVSGRSVFHWKRRSPAANPVVKGESRG